MNKKFICGLLLFLHAANTIHSIDWSIFATRDAVSTKKINFFEYITTFFKTEKSRDQINIEHLMKTKGLSKEDATELNDFHKRITSELKEKLPGMIFMLGSLYLINLFLEQTSGGIFSAQNKQSIKENFSTVAGNHEAKKDLQDVINYFNNPKQFQEIGARAPKGFLFSGNPGTGKTLLSRALAGEVKCTFIACTGPDFNAKYIGVGTERIKRLFELARRSAPCIIFIDEIDALASKRGQHNTHQDSDKTLNQLLCEMDGFTPNDKPIIVIGATNNPQLLDSAILRPGRFDRQIQVEMPDVTCREEILKVHLKKIKYEPSLDTKKIAQVTIGFSGADLANLVNEAAIIALNKRDSLVTISHFEEARDKVQLGSKHPTMKQSEHDKKVTAYHEAGHALILMLMPNQSNALNKITITPQGNALGVTHSIAQEDKYSSTEKELLATITMALGGRAAEELVFNDITTGASSDFEYASKIARSMICRYGMTNILGKQVLSDKPELYAQDTLKKIDEGISKILDDQYLTAMNLLKSNRDKLDKLANALLEKETLYAHEVYELLNIKPKTDFRLTA